MTDDPMARLAAADPAVASAPDAAAIRASVDERIWAGMGSELDAARESTAAAPGGRWSWLAVGAAACAALLVAAVAFSAGRSSVPESEVLSPPIVLGSGARDAAAASGAPNRMMPYFGGRVVYVAAEGLPTAGGSAQAFAYNAQAVDGRKAAAALAAAVGIDGKPEERDGAWMVGMADPAGAQASVQPDGMRSFHAYDPAADPSACLKVEPRPVPESTGTAGASGGGGTGGSTGGSAGGAVPASPTCPDPKPAPDTSESIAAAKDLMTGLGSDPAEFRWTAELTSGATVVVATEALGGSRTGAQWYLSYANGLKLLSANGFLAPRVALGAYDVVSPRTAVDRLGDPRFGGYFGGPVPMAADATRGVPAAGVDAGTSGSAGTVTSDVATAAPVSTEPPAPPAAGSPVPWPVTTITITGCRLGLAQNYLPTGAVTLVPAYECQSADGAVVASVVAVADSQLDFSPQ